MVLYYDFVGGVGGQFWCQFYEFSTMFVVLLVILLLAGTV